MHEMGIAIQIRDIVLGSLPPGPPVKVSAIKIKAGKLTAIVQPSLELCMKVVADGTPLEGARIDLTVIPVRVRCESCGKTSEIEHPPFHCSSCHSPKVTLISGREMTVESIEIVE